MAKRKTAGLGANALDVLDAVPVVPAPAPDAQPAAPAGGRSKRRREPRPEREPVTFRVRPELIGEARGAAWLLPGLTLTDLVERALSAELERLRAVHNGGKPFAPIDALAGGRPPGS